MFADSIILKFAHVLLFQCTVMYINKFRPSHNFCNHLFVDLYKRKSLTFFLQKLTEKNSISNKTAKNKYKICKWQNIHIQFCNHSPFNIQKSQAFFIIYILCVDKKKQHNIPQRIDNLESSSLVVNCLGKFPVYISIACIKRRRSKQNVTVLRLLVFNANWILAE